MNVELDDVLAKLVAATEFDLEQPRSQDAPSLAVHAPGYVYVLHRRHELGVSEARTTAAGLLMMSEHSGTHIDALCHQAERGRLFGGVVVSPTVQTPTGFTEQGAERIEPIIARGVLLDVAAHLGVDRLPDRMSIGAGDLARVADAQGSSIRTGDVVLVRTGSGAYWADPDRYLCSAGITGDGSLWLVDRGVRAVGADNSSWDVSGAVDPETRETLPGHLHLLVRAGIYIFEHLFLEELSRQRRFEFIFLCLPLKLRGATASPVRPLALVLS
jgi:kynurenine formamidase